MKSNREIFEKAVEKATENGYKDPYHYTSIGCGGIEAQMRFNTYYRVIFSHDFVKAFWGEQKHEWDSRTESYCIHCGMQFPYQVDLPEHCWQFHLQQMALEENPLEYLEKNF